MNNNRYEEPVDLHRLIIVGHQEPDQRIEDYSVSSQDGNVRVLFHNLEEHLIEYIGQCDVALGCVAWLTSEPILRALAGIKGVSIIVQKEDFLRPDMVSKGKQNWVKQLHILYSRLPSTLCRYDFGDTILHSMSYATNPSIEPVRCIGNCNADKLPSFPRSHHKFVLFCNYVDTRDVGDEDFNVIIPKAVWTGSYNFTKTAGKSFENAVVLQDPTIVNAYYHEYAQIAALSEPLNWKSQWVAPEWRFGT
jgi:hypothetical protein